MVFVLKIISCDFIVDIWRVLWEVRPKTVCINRKCFVRQKVKVLKKEVKPEIKFAKKN